MFDTNVVVSVTFDKNSSFCSIYWFVIISQHNVDLTWNEMDQIWIDSMGNNGIGRYSKNADILVAVVLIVIMLILFLV